MKRGLGFLASHQLPLLEWSNLIYLCRVRGFPIWIVRRSRVWRVCDNIVDSRATEYAVPFSLPSNATIPLGLLLYLSSIPTQQFTHHAPGWSFVYRQFNNNSCLDFHKMPRQQEPLPKKPNSTSRNGSGSPKLLKVILWDGWIRKRKTPRKS